MNLPPGTGVSYPTIALSPTWAGLVGKVDLRRSFGRDPSLQKGWYIRDS
ncbi:hypothetical protein [Trichothermofontia sp.]